MSHKSWQTNRKGDKHYETDGAFIAVDSSHPCLQTVGTMAQVWHQQNRRKTKPKALRIGSPILGVIFFSRRVVPSIFHPNCPSCCLRARYETRLGPSPPVGLAVTDQRSAGLNKQSRSWYAGRAAIIATVRFDFQTAECDFWMEHAMHAPRCTVVPKGPRVMKLAAAHENFNKPVTDTC